MGHPCHIHILPVGGIEGARHEAPNIYECRIRHPSGRSDISRFKRTRRMPRGSVADLTDNLPPSIQQAREVALSILKPTAKELEHGLRLHAESVVFDAYGFSPRAAVDGDALAAAVEAGASDIELDDLREEMSMTRYVP